MKFLFNKLTFLVVVALAFASCEDFLGGDDFNIDPTKPAEVPVSAQLPEVGLQVADLYGGAFSRFNCMLTQQVEGVARQWSSFNQYSGLTPNRFDAAWDNTYEDILVEARLAQAAAREQGLNHYLAIFNILESFALLNATDVWDDIPYSEAFQGIDVLNPNFDSQEQLYSVALGKIDEAIDLLQGSGGSILPATDDLYYGGSADSWLLAARAIKARSLVKQGNLSGAAELAENSFESPSDNLAFRYPDINNAAQWFRFNRDRTGDIELHPQFLGLLREYSDSDPRIELWNSTFDPTHPYLVADFLQELVTYREMQFIIAENAVRNGDDDSATEAMQNGIRASFTNAGFADDADAYLDEIGDDVDLETVMEQKYISLFLQPEVYSDWRRTDIPELEPVSGNNIPVRWDYSSTEYLFNTNAPSEADISIFTDKVSWDD